MTEETLAKLPELLFQIGKTFGSDNTLSKTLDTVTELVAQLSKAEACSIMLADPEREILLGRAAFGLERDDISEVSFRYGEGMAGWVAQHSQSLVVDDVSKDPRFVTVKDSQTRIRSLSSVPLLTREKMIGVLTITSPKVGQFTQASVDVLQLVASIIALDIENIRLRKVSVTDKLTGAYNREFLDSQLPTSIHNALERALPLSVIMLDVDHFKKVNDNHGHEVGDKVLTEIAKRLRETSRSRDMLIRYGGEEFLLLLPTANLHTASEVAERIRLSMQNRMFSIGTLDLHIKISAGVAQFLNNESGQELINRADTALYQAKSKGRNRTEIAPNP